MVFFVLVFLLLSLGAVAFPLITPRHRWMSVGVGETDELLEEKESALSAIRDLEFEHDLGILSDPDFASLRDEYTDRAAKVLHRMDQLPVEPPAAVPGDIDDEDEDTEGEEEIEEYCTACGEIVGPEDQYCGGCGAYLLEDACPRCGAPLSEDARFCSMCGKKVAA